MMTMTMTKVVLPPMLALLIAAPSTVLAQAGRSIQADPSDVVSPGALVNAAYDAISRAPGEPSDWDRLRSLHLPDAVLVPASEQTDGEFRPMSVDEFIAWADAWLQETTPIGSEADTGFFEREVHAVTERYGDIAHVMSTYAVGVPGEEGQVAGVNSMQLVFDGRRWWMVSVIWDEISGAGPIPAKYMP
jgi:hypothetical protein